MKKQKQKTPHLNSFKIQSENIVEIETKEGQVLKK